MSVFATWQPRVLDASRVFFSAVRVVAKRRLILFSPPLLVICLIASALIYYGISPTTSEYKSNLLRVLAQVVATLLGFNIIGLTINTNQFGESANIRKLAESVREAIWRLYSQRYNAHPREEPLRRATRIRSLVSASRVPVLLLRNEQGQEDYYVYRPRWDGVWYQIAHSPFSSHQPSTARTSVRFMHEATLCAIQILRLTRDMRKNRCSLLTEQSGTNGSRWFLEDLRAVQNSKELGISASSPVTMRTQDAARLINLAIHSCHYVSEEFSEHMPNPNWDPKQFTYFLCYFVEHAKWVGFLWVKLQYLRLARASLRCRR